MNLDLLVLAGVNEFTGDAVLFVSWPTPLALILAPLELVKSGFTILEL